MSESITQCSSNWRKLCTRYNLDPESTSADEVDYVIRRAAVRPINDVYVAVVSAFVSAQTLDEFVVYFRQNPNVVFQMDAAIRDALLGLPTDQPPATGERSSDHAGDL